MVMRAQFPWENGERFGTEFAERVMDEAVTQDRCADSKVKVLTRLWNVE